MKANVIIVTYILFPLRSSYQLPTSRGPHPLPHLSPVLSASAQGLWTIPQTQKHATPSDLHQLSDICLAYSTASFTSSINVSLFKGLRILSSIVPSYQSSTTLQMCSLFSFTIYHLILNTQLLISILSGPLVQNKHRIVSSSPTS